VSLDTGRPHTGSARKHACCGTTLSPVPPRSRLPQGHMQPQGAPFESDLYFVDAYFYCLKVTTSLIGTATIPYCVAILRAGAIRLP
jgi:hypothetical protein